MNNDRQQDLGARRRRQKLASAISAEQTALEDLLAHYGVFSRLRSQLWHATLNSDQTAIAEYEPMFQQAQLAYRRARLRLGEAIITTRIATNDRGDSVRLLVDEQPDFVGDINQNFNCGVVERPIEFITVETPYLLFPSDRSALDSSTIARLDQFAADAEQFVAEHSQRITPIGEPSDTK